MNLGEVMTAELVTCSPNDTVSQAAQKLQRENVGSCPVVDDGTLVGILTDRDITTRAVAKGYDVNSKTVGDIMTRDPITADPSMSLEDACLLMSDNQIRRLPIVEDNRLVGIISLADLAMDVEEEEIVAETLTSISQPAM